MTDKTPTAIEGSTLITTRSLCLGEHVRNGQRSGQVHWVEHGRNRAVIKWSDGTMNVYQTTHRCV